MIYEQLETFPCEAPGFSDDSDDQQNQHRCLKGFGFSVLCSVFRKMLV